MGSYMWEPLARLSAVGERILLVIRVLSGRYFGVGAGDPGLRFAYPGLIASPRGLGVTSSTDVFFVRCFLAVLHIPLRAARRPQLTSGQDVNRKA